MAYFTRILSANSVTRPTVDRSSYLVPTTYFAMNFRSMEFFHRHTHQPWKEIAPHDATA
jgi:hypothetical protein